VLRMNETVFTTIMITGFGIAFFHAAIPTHWLPTGFKFINSKRRTMNAAWRLKRRSD
jgi:hypothetical protein